MEETDHRLETFPAWILNTLKPARLSTRFNKIEIKNKTKNTTEGRHEQQKAPCTIQTDKERRKHQKTTVCVCVCVHMSKNPAFLQTC